MPLKPYLDTGQFQVDSDAFIQHSRSGAGQSLYLDDGGGDGQASGLDEGVDGALTDGNTGCAVALSRGAAPALGIQVIGRIHSAGSLDYERHHASTNTAA
jgi:hypothetical protein